MSKVVERVGKGDLMEVLQEELKSKGVSVSMSEASKILDGTVASIKKLLHERGKVNIAGFGTFVLIKTDPRKARNPQTGAAVDIPEKMRPKFRAATKLQQEFNPKK